jgi:Protein of unknown function (DUF4241)
MITPQPTLSALAALSFDGSTEPVPHMHGDYVLEQRSAGWLELPTGRLVGCDPYEIPETPDEITPYTIELPPGRYEVTLNVACWPDQDRVAAARLQVRDEPVASWELALRPGEDPAALAADECYGIDVEVGSACFVDAAAIPELAEVAANAPITNPVTVTPLTPAEVAEMAGAMRAAGLPVPPEFDTDDVVLFEADGVSGMCRAQDVPPGQSDLFGHPGFNADFAVVDVPAPTSAANLIAFPSGWGDGSYPVWIGRTTTGEIACVTADLQL